MDKLKRFDIAFGGLSLGTHEFDFTINDEFFTNFENALVQKGNLTANVKLTKQNRLLTFDFDIRGSIDVECDRCTDEFHLPLHIHEQMLVKFGEVAMEEDVDVFVIAHTETHFNISQQVYEYICVSKPLHTVHPDDKSGNSTCNHAVLKKLETINKKEKKIRTKNGDPRWDALRNFKSQ